MTSATAVDTALPTNNTVSTGKSLGAGATLGTIHYGIFKEYWC